MTEGRPKQGTPYLEIRRESCKGSQEHRDARGPRLHFRVAAAVTTTRSARSPPQFVSVRRKPTDALLDLRVLQEKARWIGPRITFGLELQDRILKLTGQIVRSRIADDQHCQSANVALAGQTYRPNRRLEHTERSERSRRGGQARFVVQGR